MGDGYTICRCASGKELFKLAVANFGVMRVEPGTKSDKDYITHQVEFEQVGITGIPSNIHPPENKGNTNHED